MTVSESSHLLLSIDIGSTFTDGFFLDGEKFGQVKVDTTPHDLTLCFIECVKKSSEKAGYTDVGEFLQRCSEVRFSTTVGTNTLVQRKGTKLGLLVSKGFESNLYSDSERSAALSFLVDNDLVSGLNEEVDSSGKVVTPLGEDELLRETKRLLDRGARSLVISLRNSHLNPANEKAAKRILERHYPRHYLGAVPIVPASELSSSFDDETRTNLALMDSYIHQDLARHLYKADDRLTETGYNRHLMVVNFGGSITRISKTRAVDTVNSSPISGCFGSLYWASRYGHRNVICLEIGGTTLDVGLIVDGQIYNARTNTLAGLPVQTQLVDVKAIGTGGGSIIGLESDGIKVGPRSAGGFPGPACYDAGGEEPTMLDADVVLGYVNPEFYHGGQRILSSSRAHDSLAGVATQLKSTVEDAAIRSVEELANQASVLISRLVKESGKSLGDFVVFAYGGMGTVHGCDIAEKLGLNTLIAFPYGSVFSSFGATTLNTVHTYERTIPLRHLLERGPAKPDQLGESLRQMHQQSRVDMRGEGFRDSLITYNLELGLVLRKGSVQTKIGIPNPFTDGADLAERIRQRMNEDVKIPTQGSALGDSLAIVRLTAECPSLHYEFPRRNPNGSSSTALKGRRKAFWRKFAGDANIYDRAKLPIGSMVSGPAIVEDIDTTLCVPPRWSCLADDYGNALLTRGSANHGSVNS